MRKKRILAGLLAAAMAVLVTGCASSSASTDASDISASSVRTVTDMQGRAVTIDETVERIVALTPADYEIMCSLGAEDLLVGRGEYCDYPESEQSIPVVNTGEGLNTEQIIALNPQVVLMNDMDQTEEQMQALENAGVVVVKTESTDIEGVYSDITLIGDIVNKQAEAEQLVQSMQDGFAAVQETAQKAIDAGTTKSVYFEISPLEWGLWTAGQGTFMNEIAEMLGVENIFADVQGWAEVSQEQVIERNPDVIVTVTMDLGEGETPQEEIKARDGWQNISAVQENAVYLIDDDVFTRPGPRLVEAAETLCELIYG